MNNLLQRVRERIEVWRRFVNHDIWRIGLPGEEIPSGFFIKQIRVAILLVRGIAEETLLLRAAALTFATLLFIVPFLVFMFWFIQTFNLGDEVYSLLSDKLNAKVEQIIATVQREELPANSIGEVASAPAEEDGQTAEAPSSEHANAGDEKLRQDLLRLLVPWRDTLNNGSTGYEDPIQIIVGIADKTATSGKALGISGLVFVLTTVFGLMRNVEWSLNRIWGVKRSRSYFRTTSDYLLVTLLLPFVAAAVLGVTAALASPAVKETLGPFSVILRAGQFGFVSLSFAMLYFLVPNTRVRFQNAFIGGMFAAVLWIALSWAYIHAHVGLARYTLVFSTFAAFPLLLMWTYASWIVLLLGAIVSFAYQNEKTFAMERFADAAPYAYREAVAVRLLVEAAHRFQSGSPGIVAEEMAAAWNTPLRLLNDTLDCLVAAKLLTPCATEPVTFQPARSPEQTYVRDVVRALRESGREPSLLRKDEQYATLYAALDQADPAYLDAPLAQAARRFLAKSVTDE